MSPDKGPKRKKQHGDRGKVSKGNKTPPDGGRKDRLMEAGAKIVGPISGSSRPSPAFKKRTDSLREDKSAGGSYPQSYGKKSTRERTPAEVSAPKKSSKTKPMEEKPEKSYMGVKGDVESNDQPIFEYSIYKPAPAGIPTPGPGQGLYAVVFPWERPRISIERKAASKSNPAYGWLPARRPMELHLRLGAVNLDKPPGPTSHEVVAWLKGILNVSKAGHSGTLDPNVTGVLPVLLGDATRVVESLLLAGKEYVCLMRLHERIPVDRVLMFCQEFTGEIYQRPPLVSSVSRVLRKRNIYYLQVLEIEDQRVLMRVGCEAGTYMRKLCFDIGLALGCGANMEELRRTRAGPFGEDQSLVTLHQLKDAYVAWAEEGDEGPLRQAVQPVERALDHLPRLVIADSAVDAVCHGASLAAAGLLRLERDINQNDVVGLYTQKGEVVALGRALMTGAQMAEVQEGLVASTERVIMEPGTYPRKWKQSGVSKR